MNATREHEVSDLSPRLLDALLNCVAGRLRDPAPLPYLDSPQNGDQGAIDVQLEVWLQTEKMRDAGHGGERLSCSNFKDAYWTVAQLVAHHTVNGCNLRDGDLLGSGTLSGPRPEEADPPV